MLPWTLPWRVFVDFRDRKAAFKVSILLGSPGRMKTRTPQSSMRMRKRDRKRAERIGLAGGPEPTLRERAVALARQKGEVRTKDLAEIGVPRCYLTRMCDEGLLVKIGYGRYQAADAIW